MAITITALFQGSQMRSAWNSVVDNFDRGKRAIITGSQAMSNSVASVSRQFTSLRGNISSSTSAVNKHTAALRQMQAAGISAANIQTQYQRTQGAGGRFTGGHYNVAGLPGMQFSKAEIEKLTGALNAHHMVQQKVNNSQQQYTNGSRSVNEANRRQGVTFGNLLLLMIKFGIALELIMLPSRIIRGFGSIVTAGAEFEQQLANINSLVQTTRERTIELGRELRSIEAAFGSTGDVALAAYEAASTMSNQMVEDARKAGSVNEKLGASYSVIAGLVELGAKAARAGATDVETAMEGILRVNRTLNFTLEQTTDAADAMFGGIDKGIVTFDKLSPNIGRIAGQLDALFVGDTDRKLRNFQETMAGIATISISLPQEATFVAIENMLRAFTKPSAEAEKFTKALKEMGIGDLTLQNVSEIGFAETMKELQQTLGIHGELINRIVEVKKKQGELNTEMEEASFRQALYNQGLSILFGNYRQIRGALGILGENYEDYDEILGSILNKELTLNDALKKQIDTMEYQKDVTAALGRAIRDELFLNLRGPLVDILKLINEPLQDLISTDNFRDASFTGKLNQVWDNVFDSFNKWYQSGGRTMITGFTSSIAQFFTELLTNPDTIALVTDLGANIGVAIAQGMLEGLKNSLAELLIPDIIHRSIMYNPSHVSHVEYQRQFPERYKRLYGDASPHGLDADRYGGSDGGSSKSPNLNPGESLPYRFGGEDITLTPTGGTPLGIKNAIDSIKSNMEPYILPQFKELDDIIKVIVDGNVARYSKQFFTLEQLERQFAYPKSLRERHDVIRRKLLERGYSEFEIPAELFAPGEKPGRGILSETDVENTSGLVDSAGRTETDAEKASRLIGPTNQAKLDIKIGDVTLPTDDKKLLEALAYILEYADVPQEQIGQLQYQFGLEQSTA